MKFRYIISFFFVCIPLKFVALPVDASTPSISSHNPFPAYPEFDLTDVKNIPDLYFECQIARMSEDLAIPMFYNPLVREYIEIFLVARKKQIPALSILSSKYFPIFEKQLESSGLPDELKYIPVIESGLNPLANSPSSALGLWQFKAETGRSFGLVVNETADERSDPAKSTKAACDYLKYLYGIFGDWQLSLLAYHSGPSTLLKAIEKAGGNRSVNAITTFLPLPTQRYLPSYFAMIYVLNNYKNHI